MTALRTLAKRKWLLAMGIWFIPWTAAAVSPPALVQDLGRTVRPDRGSAPHGFASLHGRVVFAAQPDDYADRLFVTDGSTAGTQELASPCAARVGGETQLLFRGRDRAYYLAACQDGLRAIWGTDGSSAATRLLTVVSLPGSGDESGLAVGLSGLRTWAELGDSAYFLLGGQSKPLELWRTDGTAEGTTLVRVLDESASGAYALLSATAQGRLVIAAYLSLPWDELEILFWESDGTAAGTRLGRRLPTTAAGFSFPVFGRSDAGVLLWKGENNSSSELWFSDGTDAGTVQLAVFHASFSWLDAIGGMKSDGPSVYFIASSDGQRSLWRSDLTPESTRPILDVSGWQADVGNSVVLGDRLIVLRCANGADTGCDLWRVPKVGGAAEPLAGGCGSGLCDPIDPNSSMSQLGGQVVFRTSTTGRGSLWASDGSDSSATELARLCTGEECSNQCFQRQSSEDDYAFATSRDCDAPFTLWVSDGSPEGTFRVAGSLDELDPPTSAAGPGLARVGESGWVFRASAGGLGLELWRAARQTDSAAVLADLRQDRPGLTAASSLGEVDGGLIFSIADDQGETTVLRRSSDGLGVDELFSLPPRYEGSTEKRHLRFYAIGEDWIFCEGNPYAGSAGYTSAYQVYRFRPATLELTPLFEFPDVDGVGALSDELFATSDGYFFLGSTDLSLSPAIYRWRPGSPSVQVAMSLPATRAASAGSNFSKWFLVEESRRLVAIDLRTLAREALIECLDACEMSVLTLEFGTVALILASSDEWGAVLQFWLTDGRSTGTTLVTQIPWSEHFWCSSQFALSPGFERGSALIELDERCGGVQHLWASDGSRERTRLLYASEDWYPEVSKSARFRGEHYFFVAELDPGLNRNRTALWRSDGTPEGTRRATWLPDRSPGNWYWQRELVAGGAALYFPWEDAELGRELWRSDGTSDGTWPVADLDPGAASSSPSGMIAVGDQVLFTATTVAAGAELWQVDGNSDSPAPVADLYPGPESSSPAWVFATTESALFLADDGVVGREIWELSRPSVAPCVADATTLCLAGGRFRARAVRRDFEGELGAAGVVPLTGDSGYFWFFAPGNPEVLLKVIDACGLPAFENFWAYSTGLTNVEVELEVVDTLSGARKLVRTALGEAYGPLYDSGSFEVCGFDGAPGAGTSPAAPSASAVSTTVLPLLDGRFEATATWRRRDGTSGIGGAVPLAGDSGYFWFFSPEIVEVLVKLVDACGLDGFDNFWVFAGGLTDVEVHLNVTDTWSGEVVRHDNSQGRPFPTLLETGKLRVCAAAP